MRRLTQQVRKTRLELGLTQSQLSRIANVSLATLQNIEAGRANPSLAVLHRILDVLGLDLHCLAKPADWHELSALGLPLLQTETRFVSLDPDLLARNVRLAAQELSNEGPAAGQERRIEALQALLLALRDHFPRFFEKHFARSITVNGLIPDELSGRLIRLRRIGATALAEYL